MLTLTVNHLQFMLNLASLSIAFIISSSSYFGDYDDFMSYVDDNLYVAEKLEEEENNLNDVNYFDSVLDELLQGGNFSLDDLDTDIIIDSVLDELLQGGNLSLDDLDTDIIIDSFLDELLQGGNLSLDDFEKDIIIDSVLDELLKNYDLSLFDNFIIDGVISEDFLNELLCELLRIYEGDYNQFPTIDYDFPSEDENNDLEHGMDSSTIDITLNDIYDLLYLQVEYTNFVLFEIIPLFISLWIIFKCAYFFKGYFYFDD